MAKPPIKATMERDEDGRERICVATRTDAHNGHWNVKLTHPDGQEWNGKLLNSSEKEVAHYMAQLMADKRHEFIRGRGRNDTPKYVTNTIAPVAESDVAVRSASRLPDFSYLKR